MGDVSPAAGITSSPGPGRAREATGGDRVIWIFSYQANRRAYLGRDANGRADARDALEHLDTQNDRVLATEDAVGDDLEAAGEHRILRRRFLALLFDVAHVLGELVEQVVNDIRSENFHPQLVRHLGPVCRHLE